MAGLPRKLRVLKRNEEDPAKSEMLPEEGIYLERDVDRFEQEGKGGDRFVARSLIHVRGSLLESGGAIYGPLFSLTKKGKKVFVYISTEIELGMTIEYVPIEEFAAKRERELIGGERVPEMYSILKGTGVLYPYYLVEPGELFYIPYTNSFAIALERFRFRGLLLKVGRIGMPGEDISPYLELLRGAREGIDKLIMKPMRKSE